MWVQKKGAKHNDVLAKFNGIINEDSEPIIVIDTEYETRWFKETIVLGWDFAGKVRKP